MSTIIEKGPFCECIKTGFYFTVDTDDRVFNGDLFYDFVRAEFQVRGIAGDEHGRPIPCIPKSEKGPIALEGHVIGIKRIGHRPSGFVDLVFTKAIITDAMMAHICMWYGDRTVWAVVQKEWEARDNLAWVGS